MFFVPVKSLINLSDNIIKGLKRLNIISLRDLLFYSPTSYQVRIISPNLSRLQVGQLIQTEIIIREIAIAKAKYKPLKILVSNDTGAIILVFFNKLPSFILNKLQIGSKHIISGKVQSFDHYFQIAHPEFIFNNRLITNIEPIYRLTFGIINRQLHSYILKGLDLLEREYNCNTNSSYQKLKSTKQIYTDHFSNDQFSYAELISASHTNYKILNQVQDDQKFRHFSSRLVGDYIKSLLADLKILHLYQVNIKHNQIEQNWNECFKRLAHKELVANQMLLRNFRRQTRLRHGNSFTKSHNVQKIILNNLGFQLTSDQKTVLEEIEANQAKPIEMMRLLQGDVGSGKTLVALLTMVNVVYHKFQVALMVPTDLLANQHYQFLTKALNSTEIRLALLTSKISRKARYRIMAELENGDIDILIGTHTLFQEKVNFSNLGYIVIDEQHRFGVQQRLDLINKASNPDVLIMTATPIPRSLTLTMFGDMTISKLRNKPKDRLSIITTIISIAKLNKIVDILKKKIKLGEKIYWICPLISQDDRNSMSEENILLADVTRRFNIIASVYPNITGMIHGKMKNDQKDMIMQQFKEGRIQILVATTVVEVGIDVPDATLMIVENAEQFGLAQLHQMRGRVGRGPLQSHCIFLYNPQRLTHIAKKRLEVIRASEDGFDIAEHDLILRGSGEILGTKQSGEIRFFFADLTRDNDLLIQAHKLVEDNLEDEIEFTDFQIRLFTRTKLSELN